MPKSRFHFSLGDTTDGPVGFCAAVDANTEAEALEKLKASLPESYPLEPVADQDKDIDYIRVYFNPDKITVADIDEEEGLDEP